MTRAARVDADARGRRAETIAAWWLRFKGYRILARRVRTRVGEIDLVARRGNTLAFVEVKTRDRLDKALAAIHPASRQRLARAARSLVTTYGRGCDTVRIDAVLIVRGSWPRHIESIWREE
ncbi:MAG: YraN family protein [Janthinobacterium lividum]